jgi:hypothetical protein
MPLSALVVEKAKARATPYLLTDGGGLHLLISSNGSKLWRLRYRFGGKQDMLSLGIYPDVSLAVARDKRDAARKLLASGIDPSRQKNLGKIAAATAAKNTFTGAQSMLLKAVLRSLITVFPKPSLGTFQEIMSEGPAKYADYIKRLEPDLQNFFKNEFFTENIKARRQEVLQRLRLLLDHDLLRSMLLASSTTFRIGEAMDQGAFVIINNSRGKLGNKGAEFFGRFFIA